MAWHWDCAAVSGCHAGFAIDGQKNVNGFVGEQALAEIDNLAEQLSHFRPTTEIAAVNRFAAGGPVTVGTPSIAPSRSCAGTA